MEALTWGNTDIKFKIGTQPVASYPSAATLLLRHGPEGKSAISPHPSDDVIFVAVDKGSLCDQALMNSVASGSSLHQRASVRHSIAATMGVPSDTLLLGNHIQPIPCSRRQCMLSVPPKASIDKNCRPPPTGFKQRSSTQLPLIGAHHHPVEDSRLPNQRLSS